MSAVDVHTRNFAKAATLSEFQVMDAIPPRAVIAALNEAGVSFILVGAYGIAGWLKSPRATEDVDVVVAARHQKKAVKALLAAFPHLKADDQEVVIRLRVPGTEEVAIDVIKPNQPLYRVAFKHTTAVDVGGQHYRIPTLEMALAMKFGPMVSPNRLEEKKHQDAHDFIRMVRLNEDLDLEQLAELGELVYPTGGKEILELVRRVRANEKLQL
jgi:hypothetical protein